MIRARASSCNRERHAFQRYCQNAVEKETNTFGVGSSVGDSDPDPHVNGSPGS
jgi:hypothetical protein